jgi:tRNA pseudouridine38-40 synthase
VRRLQLTLAYDGTAYAGWQLQPNLPTLQGVLERAVSEIEGAPVEIAASGRTDAGVHALAQVAACTLSNPIPADNFRRALNRLLPPDIRVSAVREVHLAFHPRYHASAKTYEYRIWRPEICPPFERLYVHHHPYPLAVSRMAEFAPLLEGEHDFSAFAAADPADALGRSKVRTVFRSRLTGEGDFLRYRVRGSGFLKHMVRNIVGALLEAGKGNLDRDSWLALLEPGCPRKAGPTAPARGLFLVGVEYGPLTPD